MMRFTSRNPAVSAVITTNGKRPELLRVAVRSILEQSYRGFVEVVVVFDRYLFGYYRPFRRSGHRAPGTRARNLR